jgi:hypothetical protein
VKEVVIHRGSCTVSGIAPRSWKTAPSTIVTLVTIRAFQATPFATVPILTIASTVLPAVF